MTPDMIDAMIAAGLTREQMAALIKHELACAEQKKTEKRAKDAERQRKSRASRNVTVTACDTEGHRVTGVTDLPPPVSPLVPSPKPLTQNPPLSPTIPTSVAGAGVTEGEILPPLPSQKPSPPRAVRGSRIPDGFPGASEREWVKSNLGFCDDDFDECASEFRDYWSGVPGQRGVKCDWPATFRNGARTFAARRRPRQAHAPGNQRANGSILGAYQRATARVQAQNDVPERRAGVLDH